MMPREKIAADALSWIGTPYLHQGFVKGKQGGVDCAMILVGIFADYIEPGFDPRPYPMQWHLHRNEERYLNWFTKYAHKVDVPQVGDVALFRFGRTVSHSGVIVDKDIMVHDYRQAGAVIAENVSAHASRLDSYWSVF